MSVYEDLLREVEKANKEAQRQPKPPPAEPKRHTDGFPLVEDFLRKSGIKREES